MIRNYLKVALRNLWRNKTFSLINIIGLATGLGCFILIALYVLDELSYDHFYKNSDRIYRISSDIRFGGDETKYPFTSDMMGQALKKDYPQVEQYTRVYNSNGSKLVKKGTQFIMETRVAHADSTFFDVFSLPAIAGNIHAALYEPNTLVITETTARKYFGDGNNAIGKIIETDDNGKTLYKVTAVIKDIPSNSHFNFDFIFSMKNVDYRWGQYLSHNFHTYLLLKPGINPAAFKKIFDQYTDQYVLPEAKAYLQIASMDEFQQSGNKLKYSLTPLTDIHLYSNRPFELSPGGNIQYVYIFSAVAIFILLIACINFMNLTTARSANRAKEVGVRKVLGTERKNLITQFLSESTLTAFISCILAILLAFAIIPLFNSISGKTMSVLHIFTPAIIPVLLLLPFVVGLLAGSYPAFFLSSFKPIEVLKGRLRSGRSNGSLRSALVIFQFATSIVLIAGTIIIYRQLHYIQTKNLGYNKNEVLLIENGYALQNKLEAFKQDMLQQPGVSSGTISSYLPIPSSRSDNIFSGERVIDAKNGFSMQEWNVDCDYLQTLGIELIKGRNFSRDFGTDSNAVILNEATAKTLGYADPIGQHIYKSGIGPGSVESYTIIGVVKNFHFESLKRDIGMLGLFLGRSTGFASFKMNAANAPQIIQYAEKKWKTYAPEMPFSYQFLDAAFNNVYRSEQRVAKIAIAFSVLAILIACLGLFGLATYMAEQRTKEIGIRKVLGASVGNVVTMLSKDFLKLVTIAFCIAAPLAWWAMHNWLQDFAYRINISWWIFGIAGVLALFIALFTISFQAIKAAVANPVKSLRTE